MPSCIVKHCCNRSGCKGQSKDIKLHQFPNNKTKIISWLANTGQNFNDIDAFATQIFENRTKSKYAICSEHFSIDCYFHPQGKTLKPAAVPTIFEMPSDGEVIVEQTLSKPVNRSMKRLLDTASSSDVEQPSSQPSETCNLEELLKDQITDMPSCIIKQCSNRSGRKGQSKDIKIHQFPNDKEKIIAWLENTGQQFNNIEAFATQILENRTQGKYALCSEHFSMDCYYVHPCGKNLKQDAVPTIFHMPSDGEIIIEQTRNKPLPGTMKRELDTASSSNCDLKPSQPSEILSTYEICKVGYRNFGTQTDCTLLNSHIIKMEDDESTPPFSNSVNTSTPTTSESALPSPAKKPKHESEGEDISTTSWALIIKLEDESPLPFFNSVNTSIPATSESALPSLAKKPKRESEDGDISTTSSHKDFLPLVVDVLAPIPGPPSPETSEDSSMEDPGQADDSDYDPQMSSDDDSDYYIGSLPKGFQKLESNPTFTNEDIVNDKKLIVFESCLDNLFSKVKCSKNNTCQSTVYATKKIYEGSYCKIIGHCLNGHTFLLFETQPKVKNYAAGNIMIASGILCSGQNYDKIQEFCNIIGLLSISTKSYYRYQSMFLFPAIDRAWNQEKNQIKAITKDRPICVSGDGRGDSSGHNAKYCVYSVMDDATGKIIDFEVVQRSKCSPVAMERYGFGIVMDRLINNGYNIEIFTSDQHVGIRKKMRYSYPRIQHQFDIWHYAKSIRKKLTAASKSTLCKPIAPWIEKIILHFWWCVSSCERNGDMLEEKWLSLLNHIANIHEWEGVLYSKCAHDPIEPSDQKMNWLQKDTPPYTSIEQIVSNYRIRRDLPHLTHNCHTWELGNFHNMALKYRSKSIHFGMDAMEARTKLAALTHNKNVNQQAVVTSKKSEGKRTKRTKPEEPESTGRWIVQNGCQKLDVSHVMQILFDVLQIANGELTSQWTSRTPTLPPNEANSERPNRDDIKNLKNCQLRARGNILET